MIKKVILLCSVALFNLSAYGQSEDFNQRVNHKAKSFRYTNQRVHYNYFKASMGSAHISDYNDFSGDIVFEDSSILPINLAYGVSILNLGFEAELGFSHHAFEFVPTEFSGDYGLGDLTSSKLMFNGFYKTSSSGSHLYIGAGVGLISVALNGVEEELLGSALGTQIILGGELRTNENSALFLEYKNVESKGMQLENDFALIDYDFNESSLNMGFRMYF